MITITYQKSTRLLVMGLAGLLVAIFGVLMYTFNPVQMVIAQIVKMKPNSIIFNIWSDPGYEVFMKCYIFNITNEKQFLAGNEKLKLQQVGPYVYQETLYNQNGTFNPNGTLTFVQRRYLEFKKDESVGDPNTDPVIVPNIPLLGIYTMLKNKPFQKFGLSRVASWYNMKTIFQRNVTEYLFGYDDKLVSIANTFIPNWINFPRFGIFDRLMSLDNASNIITIRTTNPVSNDDQPTYAYDNMPYSITRYNGNPGLPQWGYKDENGTTHKENVRCNTIKGSFVEGLFPTDELNENSTVRLYRRAFCRPVDFRFLNRKTVDGLDLINMKMSEKFLATPEENPDNSCYCLEGVCPKKGLGYITPCYYGFPIVLSQPHFYNADPELLTQVDGLSPNEKDHDTRMSLHAKLGVPVTAEMRIQINLEVEAQKPFTGLTVPLFWFELEMRKPPPMISFLLTSLYTTLPILQEVFSWLFMLLGIALVAATALLILYGPTNYGFEDPFNSRIGYSPVKIFPMTEYIGR